MSGLGSLQGLSAPQLEALEKLVIWAKGTVIPGWDAKVWRYDFEGFVIRWSDYGDTSSQYGWQKDHITPLVAGGIDHVSNLRPRHWRGNQSAGGAISGLAKAIGGF